MDASEFRTPDSYASAANFRNCLGHWLAAMHASGRGGDLDTQTHYAAALCYSLVGGDKAPQHVYRDARLDPARAPARPAEPDDDDRRRVREAVAARDRSAVKAELDRVLGRFEPPAADAPALREAFRHWVGRGAVLMLSHGNDGLERFLAEVKVLIGRYRKKGGSPRLRHFINLFAYEAKVSFYTCYANAWVDLIPWLGRNRGLDPASERFLRVWHHQNQPVEIPPGRTAGGFYLPTSGGAAVRGPDGATVPGMIAWKSEPAGPTHAPDVFAGQVLALHPLSRFLMRDPALRELAGRYFARGDAGGPAAGGADYWGFVAAVLAAAQSYRRTLDREAQARGVYRSALDVAGVADARPGRDAGADLLEEFAEARGAHCTGCRGGLRLVGCQPADPEAAWFDAEFACRRCGRLVPFTAPRADLEGWLFAPGD